MIGRLTRPLRLLTLLLAAMQFALPAVASVADGLYAANGRNDGSHVEDVGRNQCKPPHAGDCAICRYLTTTLLRNGNAQVAVVPTARAATAAVLSVRHLDANRQGFHSRAPPTLLG